MEHGIFYKLWAAAVFSRWPQALFFPDFALFCVGSLMLSDFCSRKVRFVSENTFLFEVEKSVKIRKVVNMFLWGVLGRGK